jgi:succinyldiaminopimelate transaminase
MPKPQWTPPEYPYDRLRRVGDKGLHHSGGVIDMSIGTPVDAPLDTVVHALANSGAERGYPPSNGTLAYREAAQRWLRRRFDVEVDASAIAACVGTKEFVTTTPLWLKLLFPDRDTILYPQISYPSYAMAAELGGLRAVPVPQREGGALALDQISADDARRALCLWSNSPANPTGGLDDLGAVAAWGRHNDVVVLSDECYAEFTWDGPPDSILKHATEGALAVHSLSKRSNLAGVRVGMYAGDAELVANLAEIRKHVGMMVPGPAQAAGVVAFDDDQHVAAQRDRYRRRLELLAGALSRRFEVAVDLPRGGFYLWMPVPEGDGWSFAEQLVADYGVLASPGEFYGQASANFVRFALVVTDEQLDMAVSRLRSS